MTGPRILVAVSEIDETSARFGVAAALAKGLDLELTAVLVEQQALFDLLALPFAKEVTRQGGKIRPLDSATLERSTRRLEARVRFKLQEISTSAGVTWSLEHRRIAGGCTELESMRRSGDILALSPTFAEVAESGPLLITPVTTPTSLRVGPVAWVSEKDQRAPEIARRIASALERELISLSPARARAGRYAVSSAIPCLLITQELQAPLDRPGGLLLLAQETTCPVLYLGRSDHEKP